MVKNVDAPLGNRNLLMASCGAHGSPRAPAPGAQVGLHCVAPPGATTRHGDARGGAVRAVGDARGGAPGAAPPGAAGGRARLGPRSARRVPCRLQGAVPCASAARFEGDPQTKHHCRPSIPLANALLGRATLPIVRGLLNFARRDRGVDPHQVT